ncbi:restriction endonuclease subunit S [Segetibacter koreensis]|uniref:restriction endonuclease subunit S n=1 Tax=Segetibacter koreensis TaxID=398037 RepID=UPI00035DCB86|nr:restriction endonuclease subunit S [Segetibacter koreensis]
MIVSRDIRTGWERVTLGEVATYINGKAFKPSEWGSEGLPIVRIQNLNKEKSFYNYCNFPVDKKFVLNKGDLLFAWSGTPDTSFGAHIWKGDQAVLNQHIFRVVVNEDKIDKKFYLYALNNKVKEFVSKAHGTAGLAHITKKKFEEAEIFLPTMAEQKLIVTKIEELFSEIDKGIEEIKTAQQQLKVYRQAVLKWAFEGKLTNEDFVEGELPKGWKWVEINDVGKVKGGKRLPPKHLYSQEQTEFVYIMAGNLKDGTVKHSPTYIHKETFDALANYKVTGNEVYITIVGACIGDAGVIPEKIGNAILTENAAKIIELKNVQNIYLARWLNSHVCQTEIKGKILSATLGKLALNRIGTLKVPLPPLEEQQQIVQEIESRLSVCDKIEETITNSLKQAEALRQSILKKAFEGKLM